MAVLLKTYRRALQAALDDGGLYRLTSGQTTGGTISELADDTPSASANRLDGVWVYPATGPANGQQRRIRSFTPSTGAFTNELGWTTPNILDEVELTSLFPCAGHPIISGGVTPNDTSYLAIVNMALRALWVPDRLSLAFAGTATASTAAWAWLDRPERLVGVLEPAPVAGFPDLPCEWRGPLLVLDGPAPVLQLNRPYTGTLTLEVRRPGDTLISGVESTTGFTTEGETALCAVADVVAVGLLEAYRALMNRTPGRPSGAWAAKLEAQQEVVDGLYYLDRSQSRARARPGTPEAA